MFERIPGKKLRFLKTAREPATDDNVGPAFSSCLRLTSNKALDTWQEKDVCTISGRLMSFIGDRLRHNMSATPCTNARRQK